MTARTFDFDRHACDSIALIAADRPDDYTLVLAYVTGLNRRIAEVRAGEAALQWGFGPAELDYLPEPLDVSDVVAIGQRINLGYSSTIEYDILYSLMTRLNANYAEMPVFDRGPQRFIVATEGTVGVDRPAAPPKPPLTWTDEEAKAFLAGVRALRDFTYPGEGSNNWAVNAAFTDNGRPYIANDPHSSFHDPNTLYVQHLNSADAGGAFDVAGFSFVGIPGVQLGHNAKLAWAATTNFADQTDLHDVAITGGSVMVAWVGFRPTASSPTAARSPIAPPPTRSSTPPTRAPSGPARSSRKTACRASTAASPTSCRPTTTRGATPPTTTR